MSDEATSPLAGGPKLGRRALLIGAAASLASATAYAFQPRRLEHRLGKTNLGELIPQQIGPWRFTSREGVVVARAEEGQAQDGYDQVLSRLYAAPGLPQIMLLIAYGSTQGGSLQLHRPETCYPGQGFQLAGFQEIDLAMPGDRQVSARRFTASRDERVERLVYWTRIADKFPRNTAAEYAAILSSVVQGLVPDGILVRVSTLGKDIAASDSALAHFLASMMPTLSPAARRILVGA